MKAIELPLPEKVLAVDRALAEARIAHAFGGALALAYYAEPRATIDIDVNAFVAPARHPDLAAALGPLGVAAETDPLAIERDGQTRWWWGRTPLDLFFAYDPFHDAMRKGVRRVPFGDNRIPIIAPEHLLVCKLAFDRAKDWLDIEQMLLVVDVLDLAEVEEWVRRLTGAGDPRWARLAELLDRRR